MSEVSNEELSSYLQEINASEAAELPQDLIGDKAWSPFTKRDENGKPIAGIKTREELLADAEKGKKTLLERKAERKKRAREIKQQALTDTFIDLNSVLTVEHKKYVIKCAVAKYNEVMEKYEGIINNTFTKLTLRFTPKVVRACWDYYPHVIVPMEPFTYQASEDYGEGKTFRVNITAPGFNTSEKLLELITAYKPQMLITIDKYVAKFYKAKEAQSKYELLAADKLLKLKTFYELLRENPFWYEFLILKLKEDAAPIK